MLLSVLREAKCWRFAVDRDAPSGFAHRVSRALRRSGQCA